MKTFIMGRRKLIIIRDVRFTLHLSSNESIKLNELCEALGFKKKSQLMRDRLFHPDIRQVDPSKLLLVFSDIGQEMEKINAEVSQQSSQGKCQESKALDAVLQAYHIQQSRLEHQIRELLAIIKS